MRIFLSYSSDDRPKAEEISLALEGAGHEVFFDRADLNAGEDYNGIIRERIGRADLFIFLISPRALRPGAYTLTELRMAREQWAHPKGRVLPVMIEATPLGEVPAYLRSVTIFEPEGNVAAEVAARVGAPRRRIRPLTLAAAAVIATIVAIAGVNLLRDRTEPAHAGTELARAGSEPASWPIGPSDFVTRYVYERDRIDRSEYSLDPTPRFRDPKGDMVAVERIAFGTLTDGGLALSIDVAVVNTTAEPIALDISSRFFEMKDDRGRKAELVYFCCPAGAGDILGSGQTRKVQVIFRAPTGWHGKEMQADRIDFHINGLLPLARGTWSVPTLATAA